MIGIVLIYGDKNIHVLDLPMVIDDFIATNKTGSRKCQNDHILAMRLFYISWNRYVCKCFTKSEKINVTVLYSNRHPPRG
mmetsp:Transcript_1560/g.2444  ORF Transcript_1560/g.2444 Transcript_1560/m.2444 type:complete len:80 (-) Transcript_1560:1920-2159(-)